MDFFFFRCGLPPKRNACSNERYMPSLSSLINIIRMPLLFVVGATRLSDFLLVVFFLRIDFFLFILYCIYIYIYISVLMESTIDDDCKRLRDAADLIEERETMPCVRVKKMLSLLQCSSREQEKSLLSLLFSVSFFLSFDCLQALDARAHVYN